MAVTKKIEIDGKEVTFKASAAVPRLYRIKFGRDIYKDLRQLEKSVGENDEDNSNLDLFSLEMFEDLAWLMARHADPANVPDSPEEFLDQFNTFSIYQILHKGIRITGAACNDQFFICLDILECLNQISNAFLRHQTTEEQYVGILFQSKIISDQLRFPNLWPIYTIRDKVRFSSISFLKIVLHSFAQNNDLVRIFRSIFFALVDKLRTKS